MGKTEHGIQNIDYELNILAGELRKSRTLYLEFGKKVVAEGCRPDLARSWLVGSAGGWSALKAMRKGESKG